MKTEKTALVTTLDELIDHLKELRDMYADVFVEDAEGVNQLRVYTITNHGYEVIAVRID